MSRAGLVAFILALCVALVACAPLPSGDHILSLVQRGLPSVVGTDHSVPHIDVHRLSPIFENAPVSSVYMRMAPASTTSTGETVVLVRRESIGEKIRNAFRRFGEKVKGAFQHVGQKIKQGFQHVGQKIKEGFQHAGQKIKQGFQHFATKVKEGFHKVKDAFVHVGHKIKEGFIKVGHAIKHAAQKVGHWMKETGKKIVKVALKVASVVHKVIGKVVGWIPGIGKPLGKLFDLTSKGLSAASNAIPGHLGGNLGHAMERMDKGLKVMSYIP